MALVPTPFIWLTYAICLGLLAVVAALFVYLYQKPSERSPLPTIVCFITIFALLSTLLLVPADIALVSSTTNRHLGVKKEWATPDVVDGIVRQVTGVYYALYALDALLCLVVVPFAYFWYEEYDEVDSEEGEQTLGSRLWGAFKYTIGFVILVVVLFLVGFFLPVARKARDEHRDLEYFKDLLTANHAERALTFTLGVLITGGTILYCLYTAPGLALLPLTLIKSAPRVSAPHQQATTSSLLDQNRERQRQLEGRSQGQENGLNSRDSRELESLVREERTLVRRERLAAENQGEGHNVLVRAWRKLGAILRPLKLILGLILLLVAVVVVVSMLLTSIDKLKNSTCRSNCGFLLGHTYIFTPLNALLTWTSKAFPVDYIVFLALTLLFFSASIVGLATIGIRFLWLTLFRLRAGKTTPNAMLAATFLLTLLTFGTNYALTLILAPQYATFGPQTFCDRPPHGDVDSPPDCASHRNAVKPCSEAVNSHGICTPSVSSTILNRLNVQFPFFGAIDFWAQFAFLGIFVIVFAVMLFRVPRFGEASEETEEDEREAEEEGLLGSTGRRLGATWEDVTGRARGVRRADYGAVSGNGGEEGSS